MRRNEAVKLNMQAAITFEDEQKLEGTAKITLFAWARRAEENQRGNEDQTNRLFVEAGLWCEACILKVGPGFGRYSWGRV